MKNGAGETAPLTSFEIECFVVQILVFRFLILIVLVEDEAVGELVAVVIAEVLLPVIVVGEEIITVLPVIVRVLFLVILSREISFLFKIKNLVLRFLFHSWSNYPLWNILSHKCKSSRKNRYGDENMETK